MLKDKKLNYTWSSSVFSFLKVYQIVCLTVNIILDGMKQSITNIIIEVSI